MNAIWFLRRYAMKPTPRKPKTIMPRVEGSGTAEIAKVPEGTPIARPGIGTMSERSVLIVVPTPENNELADDKFRFISKVPAVFSSDKS